MSIQDIFDRINGRIERLRDDTSDSIEQVEATVAEAATGVSLRLRGQDARTERIAQRVTELEDASNLDDIRINDCAKRVLSLEIELADLRRQMQEQRITIKIER